MLFQLIINGGNSLEKSNIIISIIIVICIAAGVAAYGITNSENPVFSNLGSVDSGSGDSGDGVGNNTTHTSTNVDSQGSGSSGSGSGSGSSVSSGSGHSSSGSNSGGSGSGSGHSSSGSNSGSSSSGGSSSGGGSSSTQISASQAKSIANQHIEQAGCYAGTPTLSGNSWYVPIYNQNGETVDSIEINARTGAVIGRG